MDSDGDGIPNFLDNDSDGDGRFDLHEASTDAAQVNRWDADNDGKADSGLARGSNGLLDLAEGQADQGTLAQPLPDINQNSSPDYRDPSRHYEGSIRRIQSDDSQTYLYYLIDEATGGYTVIGAACNPEELFLLLGESPANVAGKL